MLNRCALLHVVETPWGRIPLRDQPDADVFTHVGLELGLTPPIADLTHFLVVLFNWPGSIFLGQNRK